MENQNYTGPTTPPGSEKLHSEEEEEEEANEPLAASSPIKEEEGLKMALSDDPTKVKFTNSMHNDGGNQNGEAKVDIENVQLTFAGMGKEELMNYADDPFWVKLRWSLFGLFWVLWAAMLVGAIVIVVTTPGCPPLPSRQWWQKGAVYQVYPKSFKDSNDDGVGDLKGIQSKLDYIKELGVNTLWLNPVYKSPMKDGGYDISDFVAIDPTFGSLEDFKNLLTSAHENDIKIVMEFVPNHSSNEHEWFLKSKNRTDKYADYYIWADGVSSGPPNNWISVFGESAWTYDSVRRQYYFHQFLDSQPDLNLRSPAVQEELKNILKFWLDLGVDGFRVDAIKHLYEDEALRNEPPSVNKLTDASNLPDDYASLDHIYTTSLPENLEALSEWRNVLQTYEENDGEHRLLMAEAYDSLSETMKYYGNESNPLADFPFNFQLLNLNESSTAADVTEVVKAWIAALPIGKWSNWVLGNHDVRRIANRTSVKLIDAYNMIIMLMGGTPITYYGEEIGMVDVMVPYSQSQDMKGKIYGERKYQETTRDFERTPMQWSSEPQAGFTNSSNPWLPVSPNYETLNVEIQKANPESHLSIYKKLVQLRKEPAIVYGECHFPIISEDIFSMVRVKKGSPGYVTIINFGVNVTNVELGKVDCCETFDFPADGIVEVKSGNTTAPVKAKISFGGFRLGPSESVVIKFVPAFKAE